MIQMFALMALSASLALGQGRLHQSNHDLELFAGGSFTFEIVMVARHQSVIKIENDVLNLAQIEFFDVSSDVPLARIYTQASESIDARISASLEVPFGDLNGVSPQLAIPRSFLHTKKIGLRLQHVNGDIFDYIFHSSTTVSNVEVMLGFPSNGVPEKDRCYTLWVDCDGRVCNENCCTTTRSFCIDCYGTCDIYCAYCE